MQTQNHEPVNQHINVIRESSVFSGIQNSVQNNDKSAFSLLLAMVTEDKMELDEFHLPVNQTPKTKSDLEKTFHIVPQKLIGKVNNEKDLLCNELVTSGHRESVNLLLSLQPQPLLTRSDDSSSAINLPAQLVNSLGINQKAKLYNDIQSQQAIKPAPVSSLKDVEALPSNQNPEMDIESWFSVLEQARTLSKIA